MCAVFGLLTVLLVSWAAVFGALIPAAGCAATCVPMIWGMVRVGRQDRGHQRWWRQRSRASEVAIQETAPARRGHGHM